MTRVEFFLDPANIVLKITISVIWVFNNFFFGYFCVGLNMSDRRDEVVINVFPPTAMCSFNKIQLMYEKIKWRWTTFTS